MSRDDFLLAYYDARRVVENAPLHSITEATRQALLAFLRGLPGEATVQEVRRALEETRED